MNCLLQSDTLYLACRGESVGQVLSRYYAERPFTCEVALGAMLAGSILWVVVQARKLRERAWGSGEESAEDE